MAKEGPDVASSRGVQLGVRLKKAELASARRLQNFAVVAR